MKDHELCEEYDCYTLPEKRIRKETPETKAKLNKLWGEFVKMAEQDNKSSDS